MPDMPVTAPFEWVDPIFQYEPLTEEDSIRLLFVDNASNLNDPVCCELLTVSLVDLRREDIEFSAISYFWGDVQPSCLRPLFIGAKVMGIGPNLHDALCNIRQLESKPRIVWADGVCINQKDPAERSNQVALMRRIYSSALMTICYIGSGGYSFTSRSAWNFLQRESEWIKRNYPQLHKELDDAIDFRGDLNDVEDDILSRAWFRRAWVLQEVVVSQSVILQSGLRWIHWTEFCKIMLLSPRVHDRYGLSLSKRDLYSYVRNQFVCRYMFQEALGDHTKIPSWYKSIKSESEGNTSALDVLAYSRRLNSSDERDKIYALLGVNPKLAFSGFAVDYTMDYKDVYLKFARFCISSMGSFDILSHVDTYSALRYDSWVPNWMQLSTVARTISSILPVEDEKRKAQRRILTMASQSWDEARGHRLACQGEAIGSITWKSMSIQLNGAAEEILERLRDNYVHDEPEMNMQILSKWEMLGYGTAELKQVEQETRAFLLTSTREHVMRDLPEWASWPHYTAYRRKEIVDAEEAARKEAKDARKSAKAAQRANAEDTEQNDKDDDTSSSDSDDDDTISSLKAATKAPLDDSLRRPADELGIIEQHLLLRSRKTVEFSSDDGSKSVDVIIDRSSIIDQRCFAKINLEAEGDDTVNVALVPQAATVGDVIIAIHGARLPFIVREIVDDHELYDEEANRLLSGQPPRRHFMLIGECLFNDFEVYDCVDDDFDNVLPDSTTFVLH